MKGDYINRNRNKNEKKRGDYCPIQLETVQAFEFKKKIMIII